MSCYVKNGRFYYPNAFNGYDYVALSHLYPYLIRKSSSTSLYVRKQAELYAKAGYGGADAWFNSSAELWVRNDPENSSIELFVNMCRVKVNKHPI